MGAHEFTTFVEVEPRKRMITLDEAYRRAVDRATWESGHDPYNGTISTTCGAVKVAGPVTITQARRLRDRYWEWEQNDAEWQMYEEDRHHGDAPRKPRFANPLGRLTIQKWEACAAIEIKASAESKRGWYFFGLAAS